MFPYDVGTSAMKQIHTEITVDAPAETVWQVLVDFERYPAWNEYTRIDGEAVVGERLRVASGPEADSMPTFRPTVLRADPGRELLWRGHLYVRGLFDGEHRFVVDDLGDGRSRLVQSEAFGGLLAGPILRRYGEQTENTFRAVNAALKDRAESLAAADADAAA
jgi:hypothetical protein